LTPFCKPRASPARAHKSLPDSEARREPVAAYRKPPMTVWPQPWTGGGAGPEYTTRVSLVSRVRRTFVTGLLVVLPLAVTAWLLAFLFRTLEDLGVAPLIEAFVGRRIPALGTVLTLSAIFLVGLLAQNIVGARLLRGLESLLLKVPLVRAIFGPAKQLFVALGSGDSRSQEVVAVEYPRKGLFMIGFVTRRDGQGVSVFLPTSPNPTSGFLVICRAEEVHPLGIPFDAAMRLVVSGGMVHPDVSLLPAGARPSADAG